MRGRDIEENGINKIIKNKNATLAFLGLILLYSTLKNLF